MVVGNLIEMWPMSDSTPVVLPHYQPLQIYSRNTQLLRKKYLQKSQTHPPSVNSVIHLMQDMWLCPTVVGALFGTPPTSDKITINSCRYTLEALRYWTQGQSSFLSCRRPILLLCVLNQVMKLIQFQLLYPVFEIGLAGALPRSGKLGGFQHIRNSDKEIPKALNFLTLFWI